jgi:hypothetical protein
MTCKECGGQLPNDWSGDFCSAQCAEAYRSTN